MLLCAVAVWANARFLVAMAVQANAMLAQAAPLWVLLGTLAVWANARFLVATAVQADALMAAMAIKAKALAAPAALLMVRWPSEPTRSWPLWPARSES